MPLTPTVERMPSDVQFSAATQNTYAYITNLCRIKAYVIEFVLGNISLKQETLALCAY